MLSSSYYTTPINLRVSFFTHILLYLSLFCISSFFLSLIFSACFLSLEDVRSVDIRQERSGPFSSKPDSRIIRTNKSSIPGYSNSTRCSSTCPGLSPCKPSHHFLLGAGTEVDGTRLDPLLQPEWMRVLGSDPVSPFP